METGTQVKAKPGQSLHFSPAAFKGRLLYELKESHGYVTDKLLTELEQVEEWRLRLVLVRCGCGRFVCAVQDAKHFIEALEISGKDYVRDVSLPVGRFDTWPELGRTEE
jgi:hypothetical protein